MTGLVQRSLRIGLLIEICCVIGAAGQWITYKLPDLSQTIARIVFVDAKTGWACGFFPGIFKTADGGTTWSMLKSNLENDRIASAWFASESVGWAIGTSYSEEKPRATIIRTDDGGISWNTQERLVGTAHLVDIWFLTSDRGWAVGARGARALVMGTVDGGRNWRVLYESSNPTPELRRIRFADSRLGWAVGIYGILHTEDGGNSWSSQYKDSGAWAINDIAVTSPTELWVVGGWDFVLHSQNGGSTWTRIVLPIPSNDFLVAVSFLNRAHGWIAGAKGALFSTSDAGATWQLEQVPITGVLSDLASTSSQLIIASGSELIAKKH